MPSMTILSRAQRTAIFDPPFDRATIERLYMLDPDDLAQVARRQRGTNRLGRPCSPRPSCFGTPSISTAPSGTCEAAGSRCRFAHVAPLGWEHIGLTGDYLWSEIGKPRKRFRRLRLHQNCRDG